MRVERGGAVKRFLAYLFLVTFFLLIVEGALPQAQMLLFSGDIPVKSIVLKLLLVLLLGTCFALHILRSSTVVVVRKLTVPYLVFALYLVLHFVLLRAEYPVDYLLQSYNTYYFFLLLFPFAAFLSAEPKSFSRMLILVSAPLLVLGFAQYLSNSSILPVASNDNYFSVFSHEYYGRVRAFSLFNSGLNYGHFLCLFGAFLLCHLVRARRRAWFFLLPALALVVLACYTTLTRNLYIEFALTQVTALLLLRRRKLSPSSLRYRLVAAVPFLYGVLASVFIFVMPLIEVLSGSGALLLKQESLVIRVQAWLYYLPLWLNNGLKTLLFGVGLVQHERFPITESVVIDNSFLAIGLHIGLVGLLLWFVLMWRLWRYLLAIQARMPDNIPLAAMAALWSTWISSGLFNNNFILYAILFLMAYPLYLTGSRKLKVCTDSDDGALATNASPH